MITKEYIAGFFDGEGSIGIYDRKGRYCQVCARIQLTQNKTKESLYIIKYLKSQYGGNISKQKSLSGKTKYNWQLNPRGVKKFLKDITPYLILKKTQALVTLYWLKNRPKLKRDGKGHTIKYSKKQIDFNSNIIKLLKNLKTKDIDVVMESQKDLVKIVTRLEPLGVVKGPGKKHGKKRKR